MEYVSEQFWSDGESFLDYRKLIRPERPIVYDSLWSYFHTKAGDTSVVPDPPILSGPVLPEKNKSLVEWRKEIVAVSNAIERLKRIGGTYVNEESLRALEGSMLPKGKPDRPKKIKPPHVRKVRVSNGHDNRRVICIETGESYENSFVASKLVNIGGPLIRRSAASQGRIATKGTHWLYEGDVVSTEPIPSRRGGARYKRQVLNAKTGEIYPTLGAAATAANMSKSQLSYNLNQYGLYEIHGVLLTWANTGHTEPSTAPGEQSRLPSCPEDASPASLPESGSPSTTGRTSQESSRCSSPDLDGAAVAPCV